jgi:D-amino peptidase
MTLSVFISVDMEGIGGITTLRQVWRGTDDYRWARAIMTDEANAAVAGAFDAGADEVVVSDSHGDMGNLLPHELDPRADLVQGTPKVPYSMMTGIDMGFALAAFIGYHAGAGTPSAILDHTYSGFMTDVRVNGTSWNEAHLNAALAGAFGVPVGLVAGDRACCEQASARLPWVHTAVVKEGFGNQVGRTRSPERARDLVHDGVSAAVRGVDGLELFTPASPFTLEIDVISTAAADICAVSPGTDRTGPRTLRFVSEDYPTIYRCLLTWMKLGQTVGPSYTFD